MSVWTWYATRTITIPSPLPLASVEYVTATHEVWPEGTVIVFPETVHAVDVCTARNEAVVWTCCAIDDVGSVPAVHVTANPAVFVGTHWTAAYRAPSRAALVMSSHDPNSRPTSKMRK